MTNQAPGSRVWLLGCELGPLAFSHYLIKFCLKSRKGLFVTGCICFYLFQVFGGAAPPCLRVCWSLPDSNPASHKALISAPFWTSSSIRCRPTLSIPSPASSPTRFLARKAGASNAPSMNPRPSRQCTFVFVTMALQFPGMAKSSPVFLFPALM